MDEPRGPTWFLRCNRRRVGKKLLGAPGIATRNKDATRGSWPYY